MKKVTRLASAIGLVLSVSACASTQPQKNAHEFYGTKEAFAKEAVYFLMTDRFVDGDPSNNFPEQGGKNPTFNRVLKGPDGKVANVGYMGGDLRGVVNNADFIRDMGFTAIWLTPIVDNPDEAYAGGEPIEFGGAFKDGGKTGYHGYWANNFYKADEHLVSEDLSFKQYTDILRDQYGIKTVFDIVANHGSPSFDMVEDQPKFGELYDIDGNLVADHMNLPPSELDPNNPLHAFFRNTPDIMQLSNLDDTNPDLKDYLINSYLYWIEQGADAFRIDTIKHVPHAFWREMADRIREQYPEFYMFGESFDYNPYFIAQHTLPKNGRISVLDFPMQSAMIEVFENEDSSFAKLEEVLYLTHGPYHNPYDLTIFYDNHDMARINATDDNFINANNWLFTARGIPVVYMGSEMGYMRGTKEHAGNRNYYGQDNIERAKSHPIHKQLTEIANVRKTTPALQRGLQLNLQFEGDTAAFYRILQADGIAQTALVLLNKGDEAASFSVDKHMQSGQWQEQLTGVSKNIGPGEPLNATVNANDVQVWVREGAVQGEALQEALHALMKYR
ncbi:cyclomaltodextrin glucanotransferase [Alteromonas sediminis]|uniref:Cyclomaltodextrin glucanotransferase n=1 Tax=Alteromonas sediminis TaxID=2259342 RepID=A0A3N5Y3V6_9ALTE|nr:alpha-amylase family glycosyl hydrolase [Alteromonas sediminis]RPJ67566.1 cyclomaltodextrin glucanotransferase [Alteromonas sediminis]